MTGASLDRVQTGFARARGQDAGESIPERWRTVTSRA